MTANDGDRAWRRLRLACLLTLMLPAAAGALPPGKAVSQYHLDTWTSDDGLPQNAVQAILHSRRGFLWLATQGGLARYDGVTFRVYNRSNTPAIRNNAFHCLTEDSAGVVWAGSEQGLLRIDGDELRAVGTADAVANERVNAVLADEEGTLWVGTTRGLHRYQDGRFAVREELAEETVMNLAQGPDGSLWIGTCSGLVRLREGRLTTWSAEHGLAGGTVWALHADRGGNVWVGTTAGLHRLRDAQLTRPVHGEGLSAVTIRALAEDRHGNLWIGTYGSGLHRLTAEGELTAAGWEEASSQMIVTVHEDRQGSLWVGTNGGGLKRLLDGPFTTYGTREGLSHDVVLPVVEDRAGVVWIGTFGGGLNRFEEGRFTHYTEADGLASDYVLALCEDRAGNLWIGTSAGGLNRLHNGRFHVSTSADGLADNAVRAILEDRAGDLWIGTQRGLHRYREGRFSAYGPQQGLSESSINALYEDRDGALWIGTMGGGLRRFENETFFPYTTADGLASNTVLALYQDRRGSLWIGTYGGGLNRLRDGRFAVVTSRDGLVDDTIYTILEDARDRFWMSSSQGIFRVSRRELDAFAEGEIERVHSVAYGREHGMKSREATGGIQPTGWKRRDGTLLFATPAGLTMVDPENLGTVAPPPPVILEEVRVDDRSLPIAANDEGREIVLPAGSRRLTLRYTAPSFVTPERIRFRYRLEGFDAEWIEAGAERYVHYTRLPPGDYRFTVVSSDLEGRWREDAGNGASLRLLVPTPPWRSWWACCLYALALAGVVALHLRRQRRKLDRERTIRRRLQEADTLKGRLMAELETKVQERTARIEGLMADLEARNAELERFTYTVSHDLKGPLFTIKGFLGFLERDAVRGDVERLDQDVQSIRSAADKMQRLLEELLELSRIGRQANPPEEVAFGELAREARDLLAAQIAERGAEVAIAADLPVVFGDRTRLLQALQNLVANAVSYMGPQAAPRIEIGMRDDEGERVFMVRDNGIGIDPQHHEKVFGLFERLDAETKGTGIGLAVVKRVVEVHGGRIWVESQGRGHGSRFCFTVPDAVRRGAGP